MQDDILMASVGPTKRHAMVNGYVMLSGQMLPQIDDETLRKLWLGLVEQAPTARLQIVRLKIETDEPVDVSTGELE